MRPAVWIAVESKWCDGNHAFVMIPCSVGACLVAEGVGEILGGCFGRNPLSHGNQIKLLQIAARAKLATALAMPAMIINGDVAAAIPEDVHKFVAAEACAVPTVGDDDGTIGRIFKQPTFNRHIIR